MNSPSQALTTHKKAKPSMLIIGFLAAAVTAIIASTGVAGAQAQNGNGYGYGGGNTTINLDLDLSNSSNNTVIIVFNYFFGN